MFLTLALVWGWPRPLVPWSVGNLVWSLILRSPGPLVSGPQVLHVRNPSGLFFSLAAGRPGRGPQAAARDKLGAGLANEIYDEPESPNEGACLRHMTRSVFRIYDEPESPNTGRFVCVLKIYDELEPQHEGARLRYSMMSRNRHMKRRV